MPKKKITTQEALEVFKSATLQDVGEELVVFNYEGMDIYYDRKTNHYEGMGRFVGAGQKPKLMKSPGQFN